MDKIVERLNGYFERLVPASGKADTKAGEIVRALSRLGYRWWNDGDQIGIGYGNETCNPAARFLMEKLPDKIGASIAGIWGKYMTDEEYEGRLFAVIEKALDWLDTSGLEDKPNTEDMHDWFNKAEDVDEEEEEDDWEEEDEYGWA